MKLKHRIIAILLASVSLFSSFSVYATETSSASSDTTTTTEEATIQEEATTSVEEATTFTEEEDDFFDEETEDVFSATQVPSDYGTVIETGDSSGIETVAEGAVLMDADTGKILYSRNARQQYYPASITKIMTTLVALENGNLSDQMTFSAETLYAIEQGSSRVGVEPDEVCTLEDALHCVMLASGNDAAAGVAEHIGGSVEGFVDMMNKKVEELGCTNTHFENPHGLHGETHYTCPEDMAIIARAAMQNPDFVRISGSISYEMPATNKSEKREIWQHHKMMLSSSDYHYDNVVWGKTGFTSMALNTLVTAAERDGVKLIVTILRCQGAANTYADTTKLFNYGFETYGKIKPLESFSLKDTAASSGVSEKEIAKLEDLNVLYNADYSVLAPKSITVDDIAVSVTTETAEDGIWGTIIFKHNDSEIGRANVYYDANAELESIMEEENSITATAISKLPFILVGAMVFLLLFIVVMLISILIRRR